MAIDPRRIEGIEEVFAAGSRRVIRAAMVGQIEEAELLGLGENEWVTQLRACVERIDARLAAASAPRPARAARVPRLRLVSPPPGAA